MNNNDLKYIWAVIIGVNLMFPLLGDIAYLFLTFNEPIKIQPAVEVVNRFNDVV